MLNPYIWIYNTLYEVTMPAFIKGLDLSEQYFQRCVRPVVEAACPGLSYSACLIGDGSEVLGFDTPLSTDHNWGPRVLLFLPEHGFAAAKEVLEIALRIGLPQEFMGYPTWLGEPNGAGGPEDSKGISFHMVPIFFQQYLGVNPLAGIDDLDWLTFQENKLLGVIKGRVFHDGLGALGAARQVLAWYPRDIWLYLMASMWSYISEERAFMGRCGDVGDELGSRIVATRLVTYLMRLCFLMERQYAPYAKWFGSAFARLGCAPALMPILTGVLSATGWKEREIYLSQAYSCVASMHNDLGITAPLPSGVSNYYTRPYLVIDSDAFAEALHAAIADPEVRAIRHGVGSVNQLTGCTAILCDAAMCDKVKSFYR